ncbi:MAG: glycosyltransferase [Candidatus Humimicrobiaceae bacterium]
MKILICHNYYKDRGGEDEVVDFEKNLLIKNEIEVMEYFKDSNKIDKGIDNLKLFFSVFFSLKTIFELKKIIRDFRPDAAHIHNIFPIISPSIYYILKKNHIPIIQTIHNYRFYCSNGLCIKNNQLCNKCLRLSFKNIFQICSNKKIYDFFLKLIIYAMRKFNILNEINYFIAPSEFIKNIIISSGLSSEKIILKKNSIDSIKYCPSYSRKDDIYFSFFGRLSYEKGVMDLIKVFKDLKYMRLKIFGDGPLKNTISDLLKREKITNIELLGFVKGKVKYKFLCNSLANIIPSICNEVSPVVLEECLNAGIPVIGSNLGSIPEFIKDGYNGFIYNYREQDMLKEKIIKFYNLDELEKRTIKNNCIDSFNDHFDLKSNFHIIKNVYAKFV